MGRMYFPGEKAREYLPPRKSEGDIVAKFGAWLTKDGANIAACIVCAISAVEGLLDLLEWLFRNFQESFFVGLVSIVGAMWVIGLAMIPLYILYFIAYAAAWVLGWICYNKWTLILSLILAAVWYYSSYQVV